jgi:hypothetical protein
MQNPIASMRQPTAEALLGISQNRTKNRKFNVTKSEAYRKKFYTVPAQVENCLFLSIKLMTYPSPI